MNEPEGTLEAGFLFKRISRRCYDWFILGKIPQGCHADEKVYHTIICTTIEALDGSGALPQETLEYLEIQPPVEAMLSWTDLDNKVSWRHLTQYIICRKPLRRTTSWIEINQKRRNWEKRRTHGWNQEDYGRLEELTSELLELREQHKCVCEVVENHIKDIKEVKRCIAALTNKYTLVECNPEDSD